MKHLIAVLFAVPSIALAVCPPPLVTGNPYIDQLNYRSYVLCSQAQQQHQAAEDARWQQIQRQQMFDQQRQDYNNRLRQNGMQPAMPVLPPMWSR